MSIPATKNKRPTLEENRQRKAELQRQLDDLIVETHDAGDRGDMDAWMTLRRRQVAVARELAHVTASIAQADYARRIYATTPRRRFSESVER